MWLDWSKRSHRGLRTWILLIVKNGARNGAEIMDAMESTSRGWWRPSPGSVYPMLQQLADEGLLTKRETDGKYEITPQGKEEVEWPMRMQGGGPQSVEGLVAEMDSYVAYLEDLGQARDPRVGKNAGKIKELGDRLAKLGSSS